MKVKIENILSKLKYKKGDIKHHQKAYLFDLILAFIYMIGSLVNAIWGVDELSWIDETTKEINWGFIKTMIIVGINWCVLVRLHIKLYIENCEKCSEC